MLPVSRSFPGLRLRIPPPPAHIPTMIAESFWSHLALRGCTGNRPRRTHPDTYKRPSKRRQKNLPDIPYSLMPPRTRKRNTHKHLGMRSHNRWGTLWLASRMFDWWRSNWAPGSCCSSSRNRRGRWSRPGMGRRRSRRNQHPSHRHPTATQSNE